MSDREEREDHDDWDGQDRRERKPWRVKKEISLGDLIAIVLAFAAAFAAWASLNTRQSLSEQALQQLSADQRRQDDDRASLRQDIREQLRDLNNKIDRILSERAK